MVPERPVWTNLTRSAIRETRVVVSLRQARKKAWIDVAVDSDADVVYGERMDAKFYDPAERGREKEASRAEDTRAHESGEKSAEQLLRENMALAFGEVMIEVPPDDR